MRNCVEICVSIGISVVDLSNLLVSYVENLSYGSRNPKSLPCSVASSAFSYTQDLLFYSGRLCL